ncbi:MAG: hypothetical protein COS89_03155, partial [Deltaproteobacteria bacterium CG07_land_8_20_14_0_80_38_7]
MGGSSPVAIKSIETMNGDFRAVVPGLLNNDIMCESEAFMRVTYAVQDSSVVSDSADPSISRTIVANPGTAVLIQRSGSTAKNFFETVYLPTVEDNVTTPEILFPLQSDIISSLGKAADVP